MASNLSSSTTRAKGYDQAARNVACMAEAIRLAGRRPDEFADLGFYVFAPGLEKRAARDTNIERLMTAESILAAVDKRIAGYEVVGRVEAGELRHWEHEHFQPLVAQLVERKALRFVAWETLIETIREHDARVGEELAAFYALCLRYNYSELAPRKSAG